MVQPETKEKQKRMQKEVRNEKRETKEKIKLGKIAMKQRGIKND